MAKRLKSCTNSRKRQHVFMVLVSLSIPRVGQKFNMAIAIWLDRLLFPARSLDKKETIINISIRFLKFHIIETKEREGTRAIYILYVYILYDTYQKFFQGLYESHVFYYVEIISIRRKYLIKRLFAN